MNENDAYKELKENLSGCLLEFTEKTCSPNNPLYPKSLPIMKKSLLELVDDVNRQGALTMYPYFSKSQIDRICYQIDEWFSIMETFIEENILKEQSNLGYMKNRLKFMICGE